MAFDKVYCQTYYTLLLVKANISHSSTKYFREKKNVNTKLGNSK
jgi:hypothetical protein